MAAGIVHLLQNVDGVLRRVSYMSDDGTPNGNLTPIVQAEGAGEGGGGTGGLTDAQLRAAPVPISGALTDAQLRASAVPVSGPVTNAQLTAVTGAANAAAWDGAAASTTMIAILKAMHAQNATIIARLTAIEANTAAAP